MQIALLCCYPLFIHLSVQFDQPVLRAAAIVCVAGGILYRRLLRREPGAWLIFTGVVAVVAVIAVVQPPKSLFYLPPVILPALIAGVFIRSLLPGHVPLVSAIAERARGDLDAAMRRYTHGVTAMWAVALVAMMVWSALVAWLGGDWLWSVVTNFINYVVIGVVFVGEFIVRKLCFRRYEHPTFRQYLTIVLGAEGFSKRS